MAKEKSIHLIDNQSEMGAPKVAFAMSTITVDSVIRNHYSEVIYLDEGRVPRYSSQNISIYGKEIIHDDTVTDGMYLELTADDVLQLGYMPEQTESNFYEAEVFDIEIHRLGRNGFDCWERLDQEDALSPDDVKNTFKGAMEIIENKKKAHPDARYRLVKKTVIMFEEENLTV